MPTTHIMHVYYLKTSVVFNRLEKVSLEVVVMQYLY